MCINKIVIALSVIQFIMTANLLGVLHQIRREVGPFNYDNPKAWFRMIDGILFLNHVEDDLAKYNILIVALTIQITEQVPIVERNFRRARSKYNYYKKKSN